MNSSVRVRPDVVVFDVVETLANLEAVRTRLSEVGLPPEVMPTWFTRILRDAMALTLAGDYAGFADIAASSLYAQTRGELSDAQVQAVVAGFGCLTPQPDAVAAVRAARQAGARVFTLSNGAASTTRAFLDRAGLTASVERVLSIDEVRAWKPARGPYDLAVHAAGVRAERVALVAVHSWDIHGARAAGLTTGWCPRLEGEPTPVFTPADVRAPTLDGVIDALMALPAPDA
ncbi:2-haloacid dehalogenase [Nakamurella sp. UYEF19]|uniref:haloacid dehalogenase type II n=1 Tax=Nakamurella sp. UYEF19 TaxID=1756392 RepID=UPI0033998EA9